MTGNQFIPKMSKFPQETLQVEVESNVPDSIGNILLSISQYSLIALFGFLPIFFTTGLWASLGFDKVLFTVLLSLVAVVSGSLLMLRKKSLKTTMPWALVGFWLLVLAALASGLLSGDSQDALRGRYIENQTVAFLAVLALAMSVPLLLQNSKLATSKALALFSVSTALILLYNLIRLVLGAETLTLGSFGTLNVSPIGSLNDLAIFSGVAIIFSLISLVQLPLKIWLQSAISGLVVLALVMLAVANFFNVWLIIAFFSFLMLLYLLSKDTIFKTEEDSINKSSRLVIAITALVCLMSVVFVIAGDFAGEKISQLTGITYVEVRPSHTATTDIARSVYSENALLGVGPNQFADAWRLHKDININQTIFWDTEFNAGSGFVSTLFVNLGVLGGVIFVLFNLGFLYLGYRVLLRNTQNDFYWYYLGLVSFAIATFVWVMSYIYNPGSAIMIIGALFTGLTFVSAGALVPNLLKTIPLVTNRKAGFLLMAVIIIVVSTSVSVLFSLGKQYVAQADFTKAQTNAQSVEAFQTLTLGAYDLYPDDTFLSTLAQIKLSSINSLLAINEPSEADQKLFLETAQQALQLANQAIEDDAANPFNQALISSVYNTLAMAGVDGAKDRSIAALEEAKKLDPLNPGYHLISAQMAFRLNDLGAARESIFAALNLKQNFTQALYLLAQIEINEGNTESAITATESIINLEPNNPSRYLQLGLLYSAANNKEGAMEAYKVAIQLDQNYANARYLLAIEYLKTGENANALEQLKLVKVNNTDNAELDTLIRQIENGETVSIPSFGVNVPVNETEPQTNPENTVTTEGEVETDLVSPVNTISGNSDNSESTPVSEESVNTPSDETTSEVTE